MPNETIHDEIESWLAADVHDQLSNDERAALQQHLAACESCRTLQQEEKTMHQLLENTLAKESADPAFEQRMLNRFRDKVPASEGGLISFFAGLIRMRAAQITAVAALLLTLVQVGKMVTGEGGTLREVTDANRACATSARRRKTADPSTTTADQVALELSPRPRDSLSKGKRKN